jgi:flagellar hook assembly protein FlgD
MRFIKNSRLKTQDSRLVTRQTQDIRPKTQDSRLITRHSLLVIILCLASCVLSFPSPLSAAEILDVQVLWDPEDEPLNIGDSIHFRVATDSPGSVIIDISTVHQSIQLYDDGTNGDTEAGDHVYELDYTIFEGDTVDDGPILIRFMASDGSEVQTSPEDDLTPRITVDGTRPVVTNDGVSPDPFNPRFQFAYIRYILTEVASVSIEIYDGNRLVRTLGTPSGRPGENHTTWNGADDEGNTVPDGIYTYEILATDMAGNDAIPNRGGCVLTTVYMEIDNSLIAPNPFSPDRDNVDDITWVTFDIKLVATEEQLRILGFGAENLLTASTEDDDVVSPYALVGISIFDSSGKNETTFLHDLAPKADTDFAPNGWPNGQLPPDVPPGSGNYIGLPDGLPDYADEDKVNDWDTLVPLHGPFQSDGETYYATSFSVGWEAMETPDGTYLVNIGCELVGRIFQFIDYMENEAGFLIGEKWHAEPNYHHGVTAFSRRKSVIIDRKEIVAVDDDPPIVTSTNPSGGAIIDPTRESIKEIVANLDDGAGGSGVDPIESSIALLDPLGNKLGGQSVPYGINIVKLVLDSELSISGQYTIQVVPVDKRGNKASDPSVYTFSVEDKSAPTVVPNTVQPKPTDYDSQGNPIAPLTQPVEEVSAILTDGLTGSGVDLDNSTIYIRNSANEVIEGELTIDAENKKLTYKLQQPLQISDTYTIVIIGADYAGAKGVYTYPLVLDMAENIVVRLEGKTYLVIYASTTAIGAEDAPQLGEMTVRKAEAYPPLVTELSDVTRYAMEFEPYDIELSQEAELTLYYDENQLPLGIAETELSIYAFKSQAREWIQVPNVALLEDERKLTARISFIDRYYIIAYTSPVDPSVVEEVLLDPPKHFNPDKETLTFTFARNMSNYQVDIYNVAGDRVVTLKGQGRSDKSLAWDGRNQDEEIVRNGIFICRISYNKEGRSESLNKLIAVVK